MPAVTGVAAMMANAGYRTAMAGKWDGGMATPAHTPRGRGYEDSLLYFHHMNDYYDSTYENPSGICDGAMRPVDLWMSRSSDGYEGPAHGPSTRPVAIGRPSHTPKFIYLFKSAIKHSLVPCSHDAATPSRGLATSALVQG